MDESRTNDDAYSVATLTLTVAELRALIREEVERAVKAALEERFGPPRPPKAEKLRRKLSDAEMREHLPHLFYMEKRRAHRKGDAAAVAEIERKERLWNVVAKHKDHNRPWNK